MSRDYTDEDARNDRQWIQRNAKNAEVLRGMIYNLQSVIRNAQQCISGRGTQDDWDRYDEIRVAEGNLSLCQSLLSQL